MTPRYDTGDPGAALVRPVRTDRRGGTFAPSPSIRVTYCGTGPMRRYRTSARAARRLLRGVAVADPSGFPVCASSLDDLLADPSASFAVKTVARSWSARDRVDAAHDAGIPCARFENEVLAQRAERPPPFPEHDEPSPAKPPRKRSTRAAKADQIDFGF